jgi:DNA-directed RNA polymerase subunit RPC12/RpoP
MGIPKSQKREVKCSTCGAVVQQAYLHDHLYAHMGNIFRAQDKARRVQAKPKKLNLANEWKKSDTFYQSGKIILQSKRGTRVSGGQCDECNVKEKVLWKFSKSTRGTVYICSRCKPKVLDRSFGTTDALDSAYSGGAFEMNPRKH